jgi:acyl-CoA synthetase (AMP-forming)/AMP-acid ligase II
VSGVNTETREGSVGTLLDLFGLARDRGARPFLSYIEDLDGPPVESVSYGGFFARASAVAARLQRHGIRAGDRVALVASPRTDYTVSLAGAVLAGAVPAPVNHHFKARELAGYLGILDPAMIVVDAHTADLVAEAVDGLRARPLVGGMSGYEGGDLVLTGTEETDDPMPVSVTADSPALILHSSGTTGLPKAVVRSHGSITEFVNWFAEYFDDDEHILNFLPLYHQAGLILSVITACRLGIDVVQQSRYSTSAFWKLVDRYGATHMNLMAPVPSYLLAQPSSDEDRTHSLRWVVIAGRNDHWADFQDRFGVVGMTFYGSTETLQITSTGNPKAGTYPRPVLEAANPGMMTGRPIENLTEFRLVDDNGAPVHEPRVRGRIEARGRFMFTEYLGAPELTGAAFTPDGWFITGDVGYMTAVGELVLIGREGGMIRRSGENIAPREIELVLADHPAIHEAVVVGIPDEFRGQEILARIVCEPGAALPAEEVFAYLEQHLSSFKVPRYLAFHDHFEHTATFKIRLDHAALEATQIQWVAR